MSSAKVHTIKGGPHATPAGGDHTGIRSLRPSLFGTRLAACASVTPRAILIPGVRTVTAALRVMGLAVVTASDPDPARQLHENWRKHD